MAIIKKWKKYYSKEEILKISNKRIRENAEEFAKKVIKMQTNIEVNKKTYVWV